MDRAEIVHQNFLNHVADGNFPARGVNVSLEQSGLDKAGVVEIFYSQMMSRQLDRTSRKMQAEGEGFYTIASSGHEGNAALAAAFRYDDMAFLHYRDAAFQIQRAAMVPGQTPIWDMLLSFAASSDEPISGGRHKVLGSKSLFIPPQTSTIASHLPKAVGTAFSIGLAKRLKPTDQQLANDSVVLCSFGDASANHSTAQGAINTASWTAFQGGAMPLVFVCEDNGIGISTKTPKNWIRAAFSARPALKYFSCNGLDILETYKVARDVASYVRRQRKPAFLHMNCVRLYGHAGADVQTAYLNKKEIEDAEANDPLLHSARLLVENDILSQDQIIDLYGEIGETIERVAQEVVKRPKLATSEQVMASLIPPRKRLATTNVPSAKERANIFGGDLALTKKPQHMARLISWALSDLMLVHKNIVLAGEDIGPKGGVYHVTAKLDARFGPSRVINTLLDEQSILGLAIGLAHNGFLPIPEIQFLAYLHNAEDQLRGEAATLSFFSNGQYTNPMVIRIAALGYQKGFGGHFHNDNSLAVLRDIPGVIIACPSNGNDAVHMLREAVRLAREEQRIVVFIEPIALYMTRDLHEEGDGKWSFDYPQAGLPGKQARPVTAACKKTPVPGKQAKPATAASDIMAASDQQIKLGQIGQYGDGQDLAIISYANGYYLSRQAEKILSQQYGINLRVIDLRWLAPLNEKAIIAAIAPCERVLVVDECRKTGSQSEELMAMLMEKATKTPLLKRITADDCFIPLGKAAMSTLPSRDGIVKAALELAETPLPVQKNQVWI